MSSHVLDSIRYENHLQTLRSLGLPIQGFVVFDANGRRLWSDGFRPKDDQKILEALQFLHEQGPAADESARFVSRDLPEGGQVFATHVDDEVDGRLLVFVMVTRPGSRLGEDGINRVELAALAVSANMLNEYQLNRELEVKSNELADRDEEFDKVFQSDHSSKDTLFGFESLRQIVRDTTEFLGVGLAALLLPSKKLEIYDLDDKLSVANAPRLLERLKGRQLDQLREDGEARVVNSVHDKVRQGLDADFPCKLMILPVPGTGADTVGMLVVANNETADDFAAEDRKLADVMAKKIGKILQLNFDPLTGLENGHGFERALGQSLMQACSRGLKHAILHVDIDRTGIVNDVGGRDAGDEMIRLIAGILADSVRAHDAVARIGGDEFGILLESCTLESAAMLAEKIGRRVASTNFDWAGTMHPLSVCIGVAPITANSESVNAILGAVSVALDTAKGIGRSRVQVYEQEDIDLLRRRGEFQWVGKIQSALSEDRFELYAQPIMPLAQEGLVPHFEVLVRMHDDHGQLVPPARFMPAAEQYQLMPNVDRWVVGKVVDRLLAASELCGRPPVMLSINISGQSLSDEPFRVFVGEQLERLGSNAGYICFDVSEAAVVAGTEDASAFVMTVKGFGCRVSLDNVGSGLSSFACLKRIGVDYLKIDGSYVRHADTDGAAASMVRAINQLGHALGLKTIAEFAENENVVSMMAEIGVDFVQGHHFGRPQPLAERVARLTQTRFAANG